MEAARAGAAGAGFAVVAQEMRLLSDRSTDATKQITSLVDSFEEKMDMVVSSLQESTNSVQAGKVSIGLVEEKMVAMKEKINDSSEKATQISYALEEQNSASLNIVEEITQIAESTTKGVNNTDYVVDTMNEMQSFINEKIVEIATLELPNKILKLAQSDHVIWKKRLVNMISGKEELSERELADHHTCRLGKWYDQVDDGELRNNRLFRDLLAPHEDVHLHGKRAATLYNQGDIADL